MIARTSACFTALSTVSVTSCEMIPRMSCKPKSITDVLRTHTRLGHTLGWNFDSKMLGVQPSDNFQPLMEQYSSLLNHIQDLHHTLRTTPRPSPWHC